MEKYLSATIESVKKILEVETAEIKKSKSGVGDDGHVWFAGYRDGIGKASAHLNEEADDLSVIRKKITDEIELTRYAEKGEEEYLNGYSEAMNLVLNILDSQKKEVEEIFKAKRIHEKIERFEDDIEGISEVSFTPDTQHYNYCDAAELEHLTGSSITNVRVQEGEDFEREIIIEGFKFENGVKEEFEYLIEPLSVFKRTDTAAYKNQEEYDQSAAPESLYGDIEGFGTPSK